MGVPTNRPRPYVSPSGRRLFATNIPTESVRGVSVGLTSELNGEDSEPNLAIPRAYGLASNTRLKGVSTAFRTRPKPAWWNTSSRLESDA